MRSKLFCRPLRHSTPVLLSLLLGAALPASAQSLPPAEGVSLPGAATAPAHAARTAPPAPAKPPTLAEPPEPEAEQAPSTAAREEQLRQRLVGKSLFLRDGWLADTLEFNQNGAITGNSPRGSHTLAAIQIERVHLTKNKLVLEGARYGLHFLGQLASEQSDNAIDRVRITPAKKHVRITVERMKVVSPKKKKGKLEPDEPLSLPVSLSTGPATTTSADHAARVLDRTLDSIFAPEIDERLLATLPRFWQLYYAAAAHRDNPQPDDPAVLHQNAVDRKALLLKAIEPVSNEYAQAAGVAGMALYHVVVGPNGQVSEIAVARPIGFGLDENAVQAIGKARFEPALKDGQPVAVLLDLVARFRIYSHRTAIHSGQQRPSGAVMPGPYAVQ